jgi:hypothetical protein
VAQTAWEPHMTLRHRLCLILDKDSSREPLRWAVNVGLVSVIAVSLLATVCESVPHLARRYEVGFRLVELRWLRSSAWNIWRASGPYMSTRAGGALDRSGRDFVS